MRLSIGECVDQRYEIRALLGEGGMAEVYRALDKTSGLEVVLSCPTSLLRAIWLRSTATGAK